MPLTGARPLQPLLAAVSSSMRVRPTHGTHPGEGGPPFVTISRQAGAGGRTVMSALLGRLREIDPHDPPWAGYDHDLIERVAERHGIDARRVEQIEVDEPSWLLEVFEGIGSLGEPDPTDTQVYRKVVNTIRQLARGGRVILVGRGSALATADMPGGVHLRLVAPIDHRANNLAEQREISHAHAIAEVKRLDKARDRFFKRYWSIDQLGPEHFDLTLNTARLSEARIVEATLAMMPAMASTKPKAVSV